MTREELTHIREVMDKEGYDVILHYISDELGKRQTLEIKKKDNLEGIEFVKWSLGNDYPIFRVLRCNNDSFDIYFNGLISTKNCKSGWVESTEAAYVEQLKAKAKELYGEIKDGDRFDISMMEEDPQEFRMFYDNPILTYYKKDDSLWAGNYPLYKHGKWAKKIDRVRVEFTWSEGVKEDYRFHFKTSSNDNLHHAGDHLAKCLEEYLNKIT